MYRIVEYQEEYCFDSKPSLEDICPVLSELRESSISYLGEIKAAVTTLDDLVSRFSLNVNASVTQLQYDLRVRIETLTIKFDVEISRKLTKLSALMVDRAEEVTRQATLRGETPFERKELAKRVKEAKDHIESASRIKNVVKKAIPILDAIGKILPILASLF